MIESIHIQDEASFASTPQLLAGLKQHNFIFGVNGTGKTTISRIIANESSYPHCRITWLGGFKLETLVYNRDFVDKNFNELKGIFTLGEINQKAIDKIASAKKELDDLEKGCQKLRHTLEGDDGKRFTLEVLETEFKDKCWELKTKHDKKLKGAFTGYRDKKQSFKDKLLDESVTNTANLLTLSELETSAETVYEKSPQKLDEIIEPDYELILIYQNKPILKEKIIGREDVDIALMINKLNNSDWVKQGIKYYDVNDNYCPFCQQITTESFNQSLNEYFDESFDAGIESVKKLLEEYQNDTKKLINHLSIFLGIPLSYIDIPRLNVEIEKLGYLINKNIQLIMNKQKEPSRLIELESHVTVISSLKKIIGDAINKISAHNTTVDNIIEAKQTLTKQVWRYLLDTEISSELELYNRKKKSLVKAIESIEAKIKTIDTQKENIQKSIFAYEKSVSRIRPTIIAINKTLKSFGFTNFKLSKSSTAGYYTIKRENGENAKETLSEGERSFISFLYFFHLLTGSQSESGMTQDRVVVFDDPVSSLDSEILFVVCSLIKSVFNDVINNMGNIKQVFVFTHNIYFHKEVSFKYNRSGRVGMSEETFWIIRKINSESILEKYENNPINTSYELLWAEIKHPKRSSQTIQNTLRRILEYYFKILGNFNTDEICSYFDGKDKIICNSLFSWINAGSHIIDDDLFISADDSLIDRYLDVFKGIFEKSMHIEHYKMMMGNDTP